MQLLVSVSTDIEAAAALAGGADVIDAKDPQAGALGAVTLPVFRTIYETVAGARPVTAALGDAGDEGRTEELARAYSSAGASLVKIGFAGVTSLTRVAGLIGAAIRGTHATGGGGHIRATLVHGAGASRSGAADERSSGVVAVAYADWWNAGSASPRSILDAAARAGACGVLMDTSNKRGPALRKLVAAADLETWVRDARQAGLLVALAGRLTADDMELVRDSGADIAGVRGAACDGGRAGSVAAGKVRALRARCASLAAASAG